MPFEWTEDLATGVALIDEQHKGIFKELNTLLDAMDYGKGRKEVCSVLDFLENYIHTHFHDEEDLMVRYDYRGYLPHKAKHTQFIKDFNLLKQEFTKDGATLHVVVQTAQKVVDWLTNHIKVEDKKVVVATRDLEAAS